MGEGGWVPGPDIDCGVCPQCGGKIELARLSQYVNVKYCSRKCATMADAKRRQEKKCRRRKGVKEELRQDRISMILGIGLDCRGCGEPMPRERLEQDLRNIFCSDECRVEYARREFEEIYLERKLKNEQKYVGHLDRLTRIKMLQYRAELEAKRKEKADRRGAHKEG
jgi:hypothetical protein